MMSRLQFLESVDPIADRGPVPPYRSIIPVVCNWGSPVVSPSQGRRFRGALDREIPVCKSGAIAHSGMKVLVS